MTRFLIVALTGMLVTACSSSSEAPAEKTDTAEAQKEESAAPPPRPDDCRPRHRL